VIPSSFDYVAPRSLEEAFEHLGRHGEKAKLLAGGHSLLPMMKLRLAAPAMLIDLGRIPELAQIREEAGQFVLGAMTTHGQIEKSRLLRDRAPLLAETAAEIGDVQVRNRGTLGGSIAHADPAADYPAALMALEAELVLTSRKGERRVPAQDFFVDLMTTVLRAGEILTAVRFAPDPARTGSAYCKLHQPASGFAIVGVAARVRLNGNGKCEAARLGITGVAPKAYRPLRVEARLQGKELNAGAIREAAARAAEGIEPLSDLYASERYRRAMAEVYTRRALTAACERARV
jgi:carbon-monoxide dehydrogenase medium subunit